MIKSIGHLGLSVTLALFAGACADVEGGVEADSVDYAPHASTVGAKDVTFTSLSAKGLPSTSTVKYGVNYTKVSAVAVGETITFDTTDGVCGVNDPVLALFYRTDNGTTLSVSPYTQKVDVKVVDLQDDIVPGNNCNSHVSWTNTLSQPMNVFVTAFAWANLTGTVKISKNGGAPVTAAIAGGSVKTIADNRGNAFTSGDTSSDTILFGFDVVPGAQYGQNSKFNDDIGGGNFLSDLGGVVSTHPLWFVVSAYSGSGTTTLNY